LAKQFYADLHGTFPALVRFVPRAAVELTTTQFAMRTMMTILSARLFKRGSPARDETHHRTIPRSTRRRDPCISD
jgi:hypothetical protein